MSVGRQKLKSGDRAAAIAQFEAIKPADNAEAHHALALALQQNGRGCGGAAALRAGAQAGAPSLSPRGTSVIGSIRGYALAATLIAAASALTRVDGRQPAPLTFSFTEVGAPAGLSAVTVYGGMKTNRYLLETTGTGTAAFDYDNDGWLDVFVVNGTTLEGFPKGQEPTSHITATSTMARSRT